MVITIKAARISKDLTMKDVAGKLGISIDTYRKIERNPDTATVGMAKKICSLYEASYDDIFFGTQSSLTRDVS